MIPREPFFIMLDVLSIKDDIIDCALLLFPLASQKTDKLISIHKPIIAYECQFSDQSEANDEDAADNEIRLRPYRIWQPTHGNQIKKFYDPRDLKKILKQAGFSLIPSFVPDSKLHEIRQMYKDLQLEKIYRGNFCYLCRKNHGKYIFLDPEEMIPLNADYDQYVCEGCGWSVLLGRLERKGVKVTSGLREILIDKFRKIRDIDKIDRNFDPSWNPLEDEEFSLYDVCDLVTEPYHAIKTSEVQIHDDLRRVLEEKGISKLLPVQVKAIKSGLFEDKSLLIASSTSSGKTLIGELAAVQKILTNKKAAFLFVVPLVALANQKYLDFKKKYAPLGIKVALRVGRSRIDKSSKKNTGSSRLKDADIIIGTYEGVDYLLRSGKKYALPQFSTVVIDEIQMFTDEDRGSLLDGFISRLKFLNPNAQFIYLSATIANPTKLARNLEAKEVNFFERPVPIERHLLPCLNESEKMKLLVQLIKREYKKTSSYGYKGQSIVFTHSRKLVHELTNYLRAEGIYVDAYHSGLTYGERLRVERRFEKQRIAAVVTTAALGAGVDLPASQVIFHSLTMGIEWLTVAEFNQMLGRAGRFQMHDMGKVYLLIEPGKSYHSSQGFEEDKVALKLLNGTMQESSPGFDLDKIAVEVLSFIAMEGKTNLKSVETFHSRLLTSSKSIIKLLNHLHRSDLISVKNKGKYIAILPVGRAICESFLDIEDGLKLKDMVEDYEESVLDIASTIKPLKNVYVTNAITAELAKHRRGHRRMSTRFFGGQILDFMTLGEPNKYTGKAIKRKKLSALAIAILSRWSLEIFNCECTEKPYCDHGIKNLARIILRLRRSKKLDPKKISFYLRDKYEIKMYAGDIYDFLDSILHGLDAIERFAKIIGNEKMINTISKYRKTIEL